MKRLRLPDMIKKIMSEDETTITKFETRLLKRWLHGGVPVIGKPLDSKQLLERSPISNLLNEEVFTPLNFNIMYEDKQFQGTPDEQSRRFRTVLKKYTICLYNQPVWGLSLQTLDAYISVLKSYLLLCPFIIQTLDPQELTLVMLIQEEQSLLSNLDLVHTKKRFLELLPFFELEELVCCFSVLEKSFNLSSAYIKFDECEVLRIIDHVVAFEGTSSLKPVSLFFAMGQMLAERNIDHKCLFERLLSYLSCSQSANEALIPTFLLTIADLRLDLDEKAILDLLPRIYNVRTLPELRKTICALIIFKKVVFKENPQFSLHYECHFDHFLQAYLNALKQNRCAFSARDGLIGAYCRHFLSNSASLSSLIECSMNVEKIIQNTDFTSETYKSFSRQQISSLRFLRNLGLKVRVEASTKLGTVDFYLPQLDLFIEHSGSSHALHFRPHLWSGYYVMRCNLLKKELDNFYEITSIADLVSVLEKFSSRIPLRRIQRARALARNQHVAFVKRSTTTYENEALTLEEQLQFPIIDADLQTHSNKHAN